MNNTKNPNVWKSSSKLKFQNPHLLNPPLLTKKEKAKVDKAKEKWKKKEKAKGFSDTCFRYADSLQRRISFKTLRSNIFFSSFLFFTLAD